MVCRDQVIVNSLHATLTIGNHRGNISSTGYPQLCSAQLGMNLADGPGQGSVAVHGFFHFPAGVKHGRVIPAAEVSADLDKRQARQLSRQIHADLRGNRTLRCWRRDCNC